MKKAAAVLCLILILIPITSPAEYYAFTLMVYEVDYENDIFYATDYSGYNSWEFTEIEDWMIGDLIALLMDDNNTNFIFDDEVINYRYVGWTNPGTWLSE